MNHPTPDHKALYELLNAKPWNAVQESLKRLLRRVSAARQCGQLRHRTGEGILQEIQALSAALAKGTQQSAVGCEAATATIRAMQRQIDHEMPDHFCI